MNFRWRGGDVSRIEAFADGIFAITITLLIVASASTYGFYDMWLMVRDLPAFLLSFAFIMYAWLEHYLFFRRYGMADGLTLLFNALFLFLVMFLAYPLKLLSTFLWYLIIGEPVAPLFAIPDHIDWTMSNLDQRMYMMYFYGAAIIGVFGTLLCMHLNAHRQRAPLELDAIELTSTKQSITHHLVSTLIAVASVTTLALTQNPGISGVIYFLMPTLHPLVSYFFIKRINHLKDAQR
ncbi:DUF1211 domain-containing protein [Marinicella meishanensis]|uniref:DUF1211 domain-containing protein n=1 Tax=Marinicella meishanensis TaxID=2873263 RepID=UPI001CBFAD71|nr:DUF1211 domain-containing protein [Marinicella sp. NBU2979]